jgi:hypothetical protein
MPNLIWLLILRSASLDVLAFLGAGSTEIGGNNDDTGDLAAPNKAGINGVLSSTNCELRSSSAIVHSEFFDMVPIVVCYDSFLWGSLMKGRPEMRR